jgi:hypothetical protein
MKSLLFDQNIGWIGWAANPAYVFSVLLALLRGDDRLNYP